jgi:hypothetical protein
MAIEKLSDTAMLENMGGGLLKRDKPFVIRLIVAGSLCLMLFSKVCSSRIFSTGVSSAKASFITRSEKTKYL